MNPLAPHLVRGLLVLLLGATVSACGGETTGEATTCGDFKALSASEQRDLIREGVDEANDDDTQAALEAASDEDLDQVASLVEASCSGKDDDTTLDDAASS